MALVLDDLTELDTVVPAATNHCISCGASIQNDSELCQVCQNIPNLFLG